MGGLYGTAILSQGLYTEGFVCLTFSPEIHSDGAHRKVQEELAGMGMNSGTTPSICSFSVQLQRTSRRRDVDVYATHNHTHTHLFPQ